MKRLTGYIFLFIIASLLSSIAVCAFNVHNATSKSADKKKRMRMMNSMIVLSILAIAVLLACWHYSLLITVLGFSAISILLFIVLSYTYRKIGEKGNTDYRVNFRLMIFSKLLLTSGLPVIIFFICSYNFEKRLEERLKLLNYAENIEQHTDNNEKLQSILDQIKDPAAIKSFYTDSDWIDSVKLDTNGIAELNYTYTDSICLGLLKTSRLHYNDVSGSTENFELIKPFDSDQFAFNSIFSSSFDTLKYNITQIEGDSAAQKYIALSSGTKICRTPSIFTFPQGFIFWLFLFGALTICYQLFKYAINKIFGINIPGTEDFKTMHGKLLEDEKIKYLFVQGIPGSGKTAFIRKHLEINKKFIFYDKINPPDNHNAIIFNLEEIPNEDEIENERAAFEKEPEPGKLKDNWFYKISALADERIQCILFAHFEYKIMDDYTNKIKLNLIEKVLHEGKKKIIISSDIDPVEYFYSLRKFVYGSYGMKNKKTGDKKESKESGSEQDANAAFFEYMSRWNNLLGRFTNIYTDNAPAITKYSVDPYLKEFLATECSYPAFLNKYHTQFKTLSNEEEKTEDNILKIQSLSDHSYRQIWYSLTKEEQLTLYDLAEDGLINTTNYMSLTMLLNKGLVIKRDGVLILMNRSFRNFVLTNVNSEEVKFIEKKICDGQTWNDYKYPVLIILGALVYFVLSSNPEKFGNVLPLVSGVMAGIPTVLKLLSYMKPGEGKV